MQPLVELGQNSPARKPVLAESEVSNAAAGSRMPVRRVTPVAASAKRPKKSSG